MLLLTIMLSWNLNFSRKYIASLNVYHLRKKKKSTVLWQVMSAKIKAVANWHYSNLFSNVRLLWEFFRATAQLHRLQRMIRALHPNIFGVRIPHHGSREDLPHGWVPRRCLCNTWTRWAPRNPISLETGFKLEQHKRRHKRRRDAQLCNPNFRQFPSPSLAVAPWG